jgi:hypothetical protein
MAHTPFVEQLVLHVGSVLDQRSALKVTLWAFRGLVPTLIIEPYPALSLPKFKGLEVSIEKNYHVRGRHHLAR